MNILKKINLKELPFYYIEYSKEIEVTSSIISITLFEKDRSVNLQYHSDGLLYRIDYFDNNNYRHKEVGPAKIIYQPGMHSKRVFQSHHNHGKLHNVTGPAIKIFINENKDSLDTYVIDDVEFSKEKFLIFKKLNIIKFM